MTMRMPTRIARACLFALALGGAVPSFAVPIMDLRAEDLVPMASELKQTLKLTDNQQTLFAQVENRSRAVLRERLHRREALQDQAKAILAKPDVELRELSKLVEAEGAASTMEDKQLRELWLGFNDALDDKQRHQVAVLLNEQLMRVVPEARSGGEHSSGEGGGRGAGGRGRRGGMGGMGGGMGGGGAPGGGAINIGG
jgi:hypothetical protein